MKQSRWYKHMLRRGRQVFSPPPPTLFLDRAPLEEGFILQWGVGAGSGRVDLADAIVRDGTSPEEFARMVRFCARQRLPVGAWMISGIWCMPVRPERVARWLAELSQAARPSALWVDTFAMPPRYKERLKGYLRRAGCSVDPGLL